VKSNTDSNSITNSVEPEMLTVDEAAALLRVNRKTVYEAIRRKQLPGVIHLGRTIRVSRSALVLSIPDLESRRSRS
jgi:excisionase family DNA binding protein